jgi:hypothetical protein
MPKKKRKHKSKKPSTAKSDASTTAEADVLSSFSVASSHSSTGGVSAREQIASETDSHPGSDSEWPIRVGNAPPPAWSGHKSDGKVTNFPKSNSRKRRRHR